MQSRLVHQLPLLIFISFDGFKQDYLRPEWTPNLFDLSSKATLGNMESMFVTKTFPNHFSMVTGLYEDEHEVVNNRMFDPRLNGTFKPSTISENWWNIKGTSMPIWTANELIGDKLGQKRYSGSMMYPGSATPYKDILPTHLRGYQKDSNLTDNIDTVIEWLTDPAKPANFVSMYFDEPDSIAHHYGPWGRETLESVRKIDSAAGYLLERLRDVGLAHRANIIFVSDHGFAEVKNVINLADLVDTSKFELYGTSPAWSVFVKPAWRHQRTKIFQQLLAVSKKGHFRIYKRQDIPPELHYSKSIRIGDFFILADETYELLPEKPKRDYPALWGNHGWRPSNPDMRPLFLAYGPSFKQGYRHKEIFPNIDLFPLMAFLLDLPLESLPNNGSLSRIIDVIDIGHSEDGDNTLKLACILLIGATILILSGVVFILFASTSRPKLKPRIDFDDLAPGLNIDLGYYMADDQLYLKKKRRTKDELALLLNK